MTMPSGMLCRAMAMAMTTPAQSRWDRLPASSVRRSSTLFSPPVRPKPSRTPPAVSPSPPDAAASASRSKHTTPAMTPAAKLSIRLTIRSDLLRSRQAAPPPSPVPPMPAAAVTRTTVPRLPITFPLNAQAGSRVPGLLLQFSSDSFVRSLRKL